MLIFNGIYTGLYELIYSDTAQFSFFETWNKMHFLIRYGHPVPLH